MLAYGIGLGWLGCECQNYLLRQPAWAEGRGCGIGIRIRRAPRAHSICSPAASRLLSVGLWPREKFGRDLNKTSERSPK